MTAPIMDFGIKSFRRQNVNFHVLVKSIVAVGSEVSHYLYNVNIKV